MSSLRIPFAEAIQDRRLFWNRIYHPEEGVSVPQRVALKSMYGVPLDPGAVDPWGFHEGEIWSRFQGWGERDFLGYPGRMAGPPAPLVEYPGKEFPEAWLIGGRRIGKALALTTPIPTPDGWKLMGELVEGDEVFGPDGKPRKVLFASPVMTSQECFEVSFSDGTSVVASGDHKWTVEPKASRKHHRGEFTTRTTGELFLSGVKLPSGESVFSLPEAVGVEGVEEKLPVDPYLLGLWLGDGTTKRAEISTEDPEVLQAFRDRGYEITHRDRCTYGVNGKVRWDRGGSFWSALGRAGVAGDKHIPSAYLRAPLEVRQELLQGLVDSDGYVSRDGVVQFYSTLPRLVEGVEELARSLGGVVKRSEKVATLEGRAVGPVWTLTLRMPFCPVKLPRKVARWKKAKNFRKFIVDIQPVESVPVRCIAVEGADHLFLAGEGWIPTHNTDVFASTCVAYEAVCGGHEQYVRKGQPAMIALISQDLRMARYSLHFVKAAIESSPIGTKLIKNITADSIELHNGVTVACVPPTLKAIRGYAVPVAVLDEVGVWYQESDSANPDYEIYRALRPAQLQFPHKKIIGISSPWNKSGLLYRFFSAGTEGAKLPSGRDEYNGVLVLHSTTAGMANPIVRREELLRDFRADEANFARESLAEFQDSISGFIPTTLVERAVDWGLAMRPPQEGLTYVAAIDPAFRRDSFAFTIVHNQEGTIFHDFSKRWTGTASEPLSPATILEELIPILRAYGLQMLYSDQYHLESLQLLFLERGITMIGIPFTGQSKSAMYGNLQQLFYQGRMRLLDNADTVKEVKSLERKLAPSGIVHVEAPAGQHDDLASTLCLATSQVMHLSTAPAMKKKEPSELERLHERISEQIASRKVIANEYAWD